MNHVFDNEGFKKYLFVEHGKFRADGLSIWVNKIPVPVDLFNDFFNSWRYYFKLYLDHVMASAILAQRLNEIESSSLSIECLPGKNYVLKNACELNNLISSALQEASYQSLAKDIAFVLGVSDYQLELESLLSVLSHDGKKYSRIYFPVYIRRKISESYPLVISQVATRNGDLFGNVIADRIGLYRGGFGDALSILFNKLLDFKIEKCSGFIGYTNSARLDFEVHEDGSLSERVIFERISDGALWEPVFDGTLKIKINPSHPYYSIISGCGNPQAVIELLLTMCEAEMNSQNNNELKVLEGLRVGISRTLWVREY